MKMHKGRLGLALLCFNRPSYLDCVLKSILPQIRDVTSIDIFHDGIINTHSGERRTGVGTHKMCMDIASKFVEEANQYIPTKLHVMSQNMGVAEMFNAAEDRMFNVYKYDYAVFLEDDLVLNTNYFRILRNMIGIYGCCSPACMFSAHGYRPYTPIDEQRKRIRDIVYLEHHWGYAMTMSGWLDMMEYYDDYLEIVKRNDYVNRDLKAIRDWYESMGFVRNVASSQDAAKDLCIIKSGNVKINTFSNHAKYIGETGVHFNKARYRKLGYDRTIVYNGDFDGVDDIGDDRLIEMLDRRKERICL